MPIRLDELRAAVIDQLGLLDVDHMISTESLNRSVNYGLRRMTREMDWPWLQVYTSIPVTAGDLSVALPADVVRVVAARIGSDELTPATLSQIVEVSEETGTPDRWNVQGSSFRIAPTPEVDGNILMVYIRPEPPLVDDADECLAPDQYEDIIVLFAAQHQAVRLKDRQLYDSIGADIQTAMKAIRRDVLKSSRIPSIKTRDDF